MSKNIVLSKYFFAKDLSFFCGVLLRSPNTIHHYIASAHMPSLSRNIMSLEYTPFYFLFFNIFKRKLFSYLPLSL